MQKMEMKNKIKNLTLEYGGSWGFDHVQRVLSLIKIIGENVDYNEGAVWYSTYLHDWGAFPNFNPEKGELGHEVRSRRVAETILSESELTSSIKNIIFEAIENHDYRTCRQTKYIETTLLRDADFLDFLGIIGIAREFARGPKDIKECYKHTIARRDAVINKLTLPKAKMIAEIRLSKMNEFLELLEQESFGYF
jgi:HD superfamily phosphodiesterase